MNPRAASASPFTYTAVKRPDPPAGSGKTGENRWSLDPIASLPRICVPSGVKSATLLSVLTRQEALVATVRVVPGGGVARGVVSGFEALADDLADFAERLDVAGGHGGHQHVADGRRFDGAGDDGAIAGVGGHLVEQLVLRAA